MLVDTNESLATHVKISLLSLRQTYRNDSSFAIEDNEQTVFAIGDHRDMASSLANAYKTIDLYALIG